jgi:hypothetical protein
MTRTKERTGNGKGHPLSVRERATNPLAPGKCGWPPTPPEELTIGQSLAEPIGDSEHVSLLSGMQLAYTYPLIEKDGFQETSKKGRSLT